MTTFRDNLLEGKVAFVAGGTSGINLGIAKRYAQLGAKVAVCGRNPEKAANAAREIGPEALGLSADVRDYAAIRGAMEQIVDRFGKLPAQAQTLIDVHRLRVLSQPYGVIKVDAAPGVIQISFKPNPPVDPMAIIGLIQKNKHIKLAGNDKLRIERELPDPKQRAQMVRDILRSLGTPKTEAVAA